MNFKKLLVLLLCMAMVSMSFVACGGGQQADTPPVENPPSNVQEETNIVEEAALAYFANFPADKHVISPADFLVKVGAGEEMFIMDIRSADDYNAGHVKGAVSIPFGDGSVAKNIEVIPDDVPVYVYCYTGQTASQTTAVLNIAGKPAYNVQSGFVNGLSKEANIGDFLSTEAAPLPTDTYEVKDEIQAAIDNYFTTLVSYAGTPTASQNIKAETVKQIVDAESDDYLILSVRKAEDYAKGHIKGAVNIPFGAGMQTALAELPKDKKIIVYCYTGQTASQTVAVLRMLGYEAYNLQGGMGSAETKAGWLGAGFETVTE